MFKIGFNGFTEEYRTVSYTHLTLPMVSTAERPYTGSSPGEAAESCFSIALPCACTFTERNRRQFKLLPN